MALETAALAPERCPEIGWAWLMGVPPSIPATAAVRHIDFIDLVMVNLSWFRLAPGFVQPRPASKGMMADRLKGYSASTNKLIIVDV
jgi:hypothetical protein